MEILVDKISFFTPINFQPPHSFKEILIQSVDRYFYLGGKRAQVITSGDGQIVEFYSEKLAMFFTIVKVASYFTLVLPLILLAVKTVLRAITLNSFYVSNASVKTNVQGSQSLTKEEDETSEMHVNADRPKELQKEKIKKLKVEKAAFQPNVEGLNELIRRIDNANYYLLEFAKVVTQVTSTTVCIDASICKIEELKKLLSHPQEEPMNLSE